MKNLLRFNEIKELIIDKFPNISLEYKYHQIGDAVINAFFITYKSEKELFNTWNTLSNFLAIHFQSRIDDEFGKWNTYLFYLTDFKIGNKFKDLKFEIEKDTFSCRKIVIESEKDMNIILENHIINSSLLDDTASVSEDIEEYFVKNKFIEEILKGKLLLNTKGNRVKSDIAREALEELFNNVKINSNEV